MMKLSIGSILFCSILIAQNSMGQTKAQNVFVSSEDQNITVRSVIVAPFSDNVNNVYATPLRQHILSLAGEDSQWKLIPIANTPDSFDGSPEASLKLLKQNKADGILFMRITRGPLGVSARLSLIAGSNGKPLIIDEYQNENIFETAALTEKLTQMYKKIKLLLPYHGAILSRKAQNVTINLGSQDGIKTGSLISAVQVLKVNRHPIHKFIISSEREILGKIEVDKADEHLSFGRILMEKEANLLQPGQKVIVDSFISYENLSESESKAMAKISGRKDKNLSFGKNPTEWIPENPPQYGKIQAYVGVGQYAEKMTLSNSGGLDATNSTVPILGFNSEFWLNSDWQIGAMFRQSAFSVNNPLSGSSPSRIDMSVNKYDITVGYNLALAEQEFFGPRLTFEVGLGKFNSNASSTSPAAFSNMNYGGLLFGLKFQSSFIDEVPLDIGGKLKYYWKPSVGESVNSGSSTGVSATDFSFFGLYHVNSKFAYYAELNFDYYNSDFSGGGDRTENTYNISHRMTSFLLGIEYQF